MTTPRIGRAAWILGLAGLMPQIGAVGLVAVGTDYQLGEALALIYGALILSFLGGIWWGFAMRHGRAQASLATLAVVPSLVGLGIVLVAAPLGRTTLGLLLLGAAIIATLAIDRRLVDRGDAPPDWMRLRIPLSLGLGGLTMIAGLL